MNTTTPPNIKHLVERAKILSNGRNSNKGRPRSLMPREQATVVSAMRKQGCSVSSIFKIMKQDKLTSYDKLQKFQFAYNQYKLHS